MHANWFSIHRFWPPIYDQTNQLNRHTNCYSVYFFLRFLTISNIKYEWQNLVLTFPLWSVLGTFTMIGVPVVNPAVNAPISGKLKNTTKWSYNQIKNAKKKKKTQLNSVPSETPEYIVQVSVSFLGVVIRLWPGLLHRKRLTVSK